MKFTSARVVCWTNKFLNPKSLNKSYTSSANGVDIINVTFLIFSLIFLFDLNIDSNWNLSMNSESYLFSGLLFLSISNIKFVYNSLFIFCSSSLFFKSLFSKIYTLLHIKWSMTGHLSSFDRISINVLIIKGKNSVYFK